MPPSWTVYELSEKNMGGNLINGFDVIKKEVLVEKY